MCAVPFRFSLPPSCLLNESKEAEPYRRHPVVAAVEGTQTVSTSRCQGICGGRFKTPFEQQLFGIFDGVEVGRKGAPTIFRSAEEEVRDTKS